MSVKFSNNAVTTLSANVSSGATSFTVASATLFPTLASGDWTYVTIGSEVVKITAISGTTFTCVAISSSYSSGDNVELRMTAELLNDFAEDTEAVPITGSTGSAEIPVGTTAQRDATPSTGFFRFNSTDSSAEIYDGSAWSAVGGGNTTDEGLYEHAHTINTAYSIASTNNAISSSPVTIGSSGSVTIPSTSVWTIV